MEYGTIEKQIRIDAPPDIVYGVISTPEHIARWWFDEAEFDLAPGSAGVLRFGPQRVEVPITVVEATPGERFAFLWVAPPAPVVEEPLTAQNSVLVTFELAADGAGTILTVREEGIRELGWEAAVLEEYYAGHVPTWDRALSGLTDYVASLATR
jgi:uncharacterized protein YndB with AHSA1/START domain